MYRQCMINSILIISMEKCEKSEKLEYCKMSTVTYTHSQIYANTIRLYNFIQNHQHHHHHYNHCGRMCYQIYTQVIICNSKKIC